MSTQILQLAWNLSEFSEMLSHVAENSITVLYIPSLPFGVKPSCGRFTQAQKNMSSNMTSKLPDITAVLLLLLLLLLPSNNHPNQHIHHPSLPSLHLGSCGSPHVSRSVGPRCSRKPSPGPWGKPSEPPEKTSRSSQNHQFRSRGTL